MSDIPGLDIFFAPGALTPDQLVSDMRAGGFRHVGLYAYDDDVSSLNGCSAAHIDAVRAAGMVPIPIITQRSAESDISDELLFSLRDKHWLNGPVWFDIEDTATPAVEIVKAELASLGKAGYGPFMSYLWRPNVWEPIYGPLFQYKWWGGGSTTVIPDGWDAIQTGFWVGPSGTNYDTDVFRSYVFGGNDMAFVFRNDDDGGEYECGEFTIDHIPDPGTASLYMATQQLLHGNSGQLVNLQARAASRLATLVSAVVAALPAGTGGLTAAQDAELKDVQTRVDKDLAP